MTGNNKLPSDFTRLQRRRYGAPAAWLPTRLLAPPPLTPRPKLVPPPPGSVIVGHDAATRAPVFVGPEERTKGLYVLGIQGSGKSSLLEDLIVQDMRRGAGVCVLDPHHELVDHCLARVPDARADDVVLLDLRDTQAPFGINLFDCSRPHDPQGIAETRQRVMRVFQRLWGPDGENPSWGIQIEELLGMATATFIENPGMTLAEIPELFENERFRQAVVAGVTNPDVRRFWLGRYAAMSEREQRSYTDSTRRRVQEFLVSPIVKHIVAQPRTTFAIRDILAQGKLLFVALDPLLKELTALVGATILELIGDAAFDRPAGQRRQFYVYADEAQRFATSNLNELIPQMRKFRISIILAHQYRGQFPRSHPMREATTGMGSFVVFRTKPEDARELADHFDTTPEAARQIPLDPLGELERGRHPDNGVLRLVRRLRGLLAEERGAIERDVAYGRETYREAQRAWLAGSVELPVSATTQVAQLRERINDALVRALEGEPPETVSLGSGGLSPVVAELCQRLAAAPAPLLVHAADQTSSRAEKRAQVENALKSLPRYRTYAKLLRAMPTGNEVTEEHVLLTPHFQPMDERPAARAWVAALRLASSQRYGTPVAEIEAALRTRQASGGAGDADDGPEPAVRPAPRSRGPRPAPLSGQPSAAAPAHQPASGRPRLVHEAVVDDDEEW